MFKFCEILSKSSAIALSFALCGLNSAIAVEIFPLDPIDSEAIDTLEEDPLAELTSVRQLSDVEPTDWAYEALNSLMERYGVIAGYPNLTFRGDRALSRYEFAAALNTLTGRIEELIAKTTSDLALREDIETLQRLQAEFAEELVTVGTTVDALESRVAQLESNAFSTTMKFTGLAFMHASGIGFSGDTFQQEGTPIPGTPLKLPGRDANNDPIVTTLTGAPEITLGQAVLFYLDGSFSGRDRFRFSFAQTNTNPPSYELQSAGFINAFGTHTVETNPVFPLGNNASIGMLDLFYSFPVTDDLFLTIGQARIDGFLDTNPYTGFFNGIGMRESLVSPLFLDIIGRAMGVLAEWRISPELMLSAHYGASIEESYTDFLENLGSDFTVQLTYSPSDDFTVRLGYDRSRVPSDEAPFFRLANSFAGAVDDGFGGIIEQNNADNFLLNFDWRLSERFALFGRYSYSTFNLIPQDSSRSEGDVSVQAFQLGMAFSDLGKEGARALFDVVIPFNILSGREFLIGGNGDGDTQVNFNATYVYPVNNNVFIVPSVYGIFNANNFGSNPFVYGGTLRTQFVF